MIQQPLLIPIIHEGLARYQLVETWDFDCLGSEEKVPEGFVADGASVPRIFWPFMPPDGQHRAAALAHDWIYANKGEMDELGMFVQRKQADGIFHSLLLQAGVGRFRAWLAYRAVRRGGWLAWNRSKGEPIILPVRNAAPHSVIRKPRIFRHLYAIGA